MFVRMCTWMYPECSTMSISWAISSDHTCSVVGSRKAFLYHNFKGFAPMTLKIWEKLRSGIVDTHPRRLQQLRQKHAPSCAFQNDNNNWGRVPNTGRCQIQDPASNKNIIRFFFLLACLFLRLFVFVFVFCFGNGCGKS
jgi:hypothetical protein